MRLDHLLSKEKKQVRTGYTVLLSSALCNLEAKLLGRGRAAYTNKKMLMKASFQHICFICARTTDNAKIPVAMRLGETPVPIPNTMVKTQEADGTMLETAWESRWLPD